MAENPNPYDRVIKNTKFPQFRYSNVSPPALTFF
jgi:hypothetical protein